MVMVVEKSRLAPHYILLVSILLSGGGGVSHDGGEAGVLIICRWWLGSGGDGPYPWQKRSEKRSSVSTSSSNQHLFKMPHHTIVPHS